MQSIATSIAVASALSCLVFGFIGWAFISIAGAVVSPSSKYPKLPRILALLGAWLVSLPTCVTVIEHTSLASMVWGHAGELLVLPYLLCSAVIFGVFLVCFGKINSSNNAVKRDA